MDDARCEPWVDDAGVRVLLPLLMAESRQLTFGRTEVLTPSRRSTNAAAPFHLESLSKTELAGKSAEHVTF